MKLGDGDGFNTMKRCARCEQHLPRETFARDRISRDGRGSYCLECNRARCKEWYDNLTPLAKKRQIRNSQAARHRSYGLSVLQFERLKQAQDNKCAACERVNSELVVDHCHESGLVRGLLCHSCNLALGHLADDAALLQKLISYLSDPPVLRFGIEVHRPAKPEQMSLDEATG